MPGSKHESNDTAKLPQLDKFRELARELEADEDEARFEDQVRRITPKAPPAPEKKPD